MKPGLYEKLMTRGLAADLQALGPEFEVSQETLDQAEAPRVLSQHLADIILRKLESLKDTDQRIALVNNVATLLEQWDEEAVDSRLLQLLSVQPTNTMAKVVPIRPAIPLSATDLLVNARGEHRIGAELIKELQSADRVDLLCSFLKWTGFRMLSDALAAFAQRGGQLRVLTTCYLGATDVKALDALAQLGQVKVSYDSRRTRLHAKAWLFHRDSGYSTAYIGSSNMSAPALVEGLEWNVRVSRTENPRVLKKFESTFESYWQDCEFESYQTERDRDRFVSAVKEERGDYTVSYLNYHLDVTPYPFQREILDRLEAERELHGRWKNLVVAATGTGKTVMAALDYHRVQGSLPRARLLFVAHRQEILEQSLVTFRGVMKDGSFGEMWTGQHQPTQSDHLFASVQKLASEDLETMASDHFDVLIVDEFHHAAAPTYQRLLDHFQPRLLLGLTATPERADGQSVTGWFDGHVAAELRLWHALDRGLLCPFQYFGVHDNTNLESVPSRGRHYLVSGLETLYTGDQARVGIIVRQLKARVSNLDKMRALGFCVSVEHAKFMTSQFVRAGFRAAYVTGETKSPERRATIKSLKNGELQIIFSVDVFNEGVDLPEVDTLLLLRPSESATIFLQQLGRGLRLHKGKECLTVLDFIGYARKEFRFDLVYRALLGGSRKELEEQVEQGFPHLPSGCSLQLDRESAKIVLENVRRSVKGNRAFLKQELGHLGPTTSLAEFLHRAQVDLSDLYRGKIPGWMPLRAAVHFENDESGAEKLAKAISRLIHLDSLEQLTYWQQLVGAPAPPEKLPTDVRRRKLLAMLHFSLWSPEEAKTPILEQLKALWSDPWAVPELRALLPVLRQRITHRAWPFDELPEVPLSVHCHYSLSEILAAFGVLTPESPHRIREGVYYHQPSGCDLFFITVRKNEKDYSPSTLYRDFAISQQLFHWESQSTTRADSPTGRRYQSHQGKGKRALLFVRETSKDERGSASPYLFLGPAEYVSHEGDQPMAVTWKLRVPIPAAEYFELGLVG